MTADESLSETPDEQLWPLLLAGKGSAFDELYRRYSHQLLPFLQSFTRQAHDAEDLLQDLWTKLLVLLPQQQPPDSPRAWLFRVARNHAIDWKRRRKKRSGEQSLESGIDVVSPVQIDFERLEREFAECLESLSIEYQDVLRADLAGISVEEQASQAGVPKGTIFTRRSRGRELVRQCVEGKMSL